MVEFGNDSRGRGQLRNGLIYYTVIVTISFILAMTYVVPFSENKILFIPLALLIARAFLVARLCGVSFNDKTLIIRRLHQRWDFGLDQIVGLKRWKIYRLTRMEVVEFGQVKKYYFAPNHFGLFAYVLGRYNWKYAAFDDFVELVKQRIPENRSKHGLA